MNGSEKFDIIIVGGGASGLAAAISAARSRKGLSAAVLERLDRTGKKLLATGNGRCNLTNREIKPEYYRGSCKSLLSISRKFDTERFFGSLGVVCVPDEQGRVYPMSYAAASVLDALRLEAKKLGIAEICGVKAEHLQKKGDLFVISAQNRKFFAKTVILAGGGKAQSALGSDGSALGLCRELGISVSEPFPALVPLKTELPLTKPLKGQRLKAAVTYLSNGRPIDSSKGEVQFSDGLLSGICVFDLSGLYRDLPKNAELRLDLLPDILDKEALSVLKKIREIRADAPLEDLLSGILPKRVGIYLLKSRGFPQLSEKAGKLSDSQLEALCHTLKALSFPITGTAGFDRAQVTGGGVPDSEINERFEAKKVKDLYICGEMLDIYGKCGGYNLDFAFSSGFFAGKNAANALGDL